MNSAKLGVVVMFLLAYSSETSAQVDRFVAGTHYRVLDNPVRTEDSSKVEVVELFWYGCPGCYVFEPFMADWEQSQPEDVDHKRLPAVWNPITEIHAQAYYAAQSLDAMGAVHERFFDEIHVNRNRLHNEVVIRDFFESCGIAKEDFDRVFNSFSVRTRVRQAQSQMSSYGQAETPSIYVNGKYVVTAGTGGYQQMLEVVDYLIGIERS